jgi:hypothetical protein
MVLFLLLIVSHIEPSPDGTWTLENSYGQVVVSVSTADGFGSIVRLFDKRRTYEAIGKSGVLFAIEFGQFRPATQGTKIALRVDTLVLTSPFFVSPEGTKLDLETVFKITLTGNRIFVAYDFIAHGTVDVPAALNLSYRTVLWDSLTSYSQNGIAENAYLPVLPPGRFVITHQDQIVEFKDAAERLYFIYPNPAYAFTMCQRIGDQNQFVWTILYAGGPYVKPVQSSGGTKIHSVLPAQAVVSRAVEIIFGSDYLPALDGICAYFSSLPNGYEQAIAMMFDNLPVDEAVDSSAFIVPDVTDTLVKTYGRDMGRLLLAHPRMKSGWLLLPDYIRSESEIANSAETRWWRVHSKKRRMLTRASKEYIQWLCDLERHVIRRGYENQVRLGSHGYHHDPPFEYEVGGPNSPSWEFEYYDPVGHDSTFAVIKEDLEAMGLTQKSMRFIRFPGIKYTQSTIEALIKYGFILYDKEVYSPIYDHPSTCVLHSPDGRIWGITSTWVGDRPDSYRWMSTVLKKGKLLLTAGHPAAWFKTESRYQEIDHAFRSAEKDFPHLGYLFPDEYGEFMDELYDIRNITSFYSTSHFCEVRFDGTAAHGETMIVEFDTTQYHFDGEILVDGNIISAYEIRNNRIFIILPSLTAGAHRLTIPLLVKPLSFPKSGIKCVPNPLTNTGDILFIADPTQACALVIYNTVGQIVRQIPVELKNSNRGHYRWDTTDTTGKVVPAGVYIIELRNGTTHYRQKVVVIR